MNVVIIDLVFLIIQNKQKKHILKISPKKYEINFLICNNMIYFE